MAAEKQSGNAAEKQSAHEGLSVGIDLGTSRSAISSSNGEQFVVDSFVGWPADLVARKVLQRDLLIGRDALDNRTMLDLHRPLERGLLPRSCGPSALTVPRRSGSMNFAVS